MREIDTAGINEAIEQLKQYMDDGSVQSFVSALEALKAAPDDESVLAKMLDAFDALGISQGAVLTYAPYIAFLVSDNPFADD